MIQILFSKTLKNLWVGNSVEPSVQQKQFIVKELIIVRNFIITILLIILT